MEITEKLNKVDELKAKLDGYGQLAPDVLKRINYKFRLDWNYYSNSMEGNTLTKDETRSIMIGNITIHGKPIRDVLEMRGHDQAITDILKIGKGELNISEKRIKDIHRAIMHEESDEDKAKIGNWKTVDNYIYTYKNERFDFTGPNEVQEQMHSLINWLAAENDKQGKKGAMHPVVLAIEFHLRYLTIHPFYDGNGRTARIFMNLILISKGYPPLVIKGSEKKQYYQYLGDIQAYGGGRDFYYDFMLDLLIRSMELVDTAINGGDIEEDEDIDKRIQLLRNRLSKADIVTEVRSLGSTNEVLAKSIFPLFQRLEEKLENLKDLFHSAERRIEYTDKGTGRVLGSPQTTWDNIYGNWLKKRVANNEEVDPQGLTELHYYYRFKGFKKSLNLQYLSVQLDFNFYEFDFSVRRSNDHHSEKKFGYSQMIDKTSEKELIKTIMGDVLRKIEEASGIEE